MRSERDRDRRDDFREAEKSVDWKHVRTGDFNAKAALHKAVTCEVTGRERYNACPPERKYSSPKGLLSPFSRPSWADAGIKRGKCCAFDKWVMLCLHLPQKQGMETEEEMEENNHEKGGVG